MTGLATFTAEHFGLPPCATPPSLRDADARWDAAWEALNRRDYAEFDRITGFEMPKGDAE